jgi:hypothetical protein
MAFGLSRTNDRRVRRLRQQRRSSKERGCTAADHAGRGVPQHVTARDGELRGNRDVEVTAMRAHD